MQEQSPTCEVFFRLPFVVHAAGALDEGLYAGTESAVKHAYLDAVLEEVRGFVADTGDVGAKVGSVTLGGGSLSAFPADEVRRFFREVARIMALPRSTPVFAQIDPGLFSVGHAAELKAFGQPHIDIRYFTSDLTEGELLGCSVSEAEMQKTDMVLEHSGISDVGMRIVVGLRGQSEKALIKTLSTARRSTVHRFDLVPLSLDHPLAAPLEETSTLYDCAYDWLENHGYHRRTALHFAQDGHENPLALWWYTPLERDNDHAVLAFGCGALSCFDGMMWMNTGDVNHYIRSCNDPQAITESVVTLDEPSRRLRERMNELYHCGWIHNDVCDESLVEEGLLARKGDEVALTTKGCLLIPEVFRRLVNSSV